MRIFCLSVLVAGLWGPGWAAELPVHSSAERTGASEITVSWGATVGRFYAVKTTESFPAEWVWLATDPAVIEATTSRIELQVAIDPVLTRFYRVVELSGDPDNPDPEQLAWIPAGMFVMGSPDTEVDRWFNEGPQTTVTLSGGFFMGRYEVTQEQFLELMRFNPSHDKTNPRYPVDRVTWHDATNYCGRLTDRDRLAGRLPPGWEYRLPTDAQWEYACRAGTTTPFAFGEALGSDQANFDGNSPYGGAPVGPFLNRPTVVGSYEPNAWGLYDMHGNVWEFCRDWYGDFLPGGVVTDPLGPSSGLDRVVRGGCWECTGRYCRSATREWFSPLGTALDLGFRVVLERVL